MADKPLTLEEGAARLRQHYQQEGRLANLAGTGKERCPYTTAAPPEQPWNVRAAVEWLRGWYEVENDKLIIDAIFTDAKEVVLHGPPVPHEMQQVFGDYAKSKVTGVVALVDGIHVAYEDGSHIVFAPKEPK